ncbi:MAG: hypothetical protein HY905_25630 [Deltaproteobacteria bacterium]|nr:hypothetical protein [Deltaproteobacteria bacterium]
MRLLWAGLVFVAGIAALLIPSEVRAWGATGEVRLCDNRNTSDCSTGCYKEYAAGTMQIDISNVSIATWTNCSGVPIGNTLQRLVFRIPSWSAELYQDIGFEGGITWVNSGVTVVDVTAANADSISLLGPAVRFCDDAGCTRFTDVLDTWTDSNPNSDSDTGGGRTDLPGRVTRNDFTAAHGTMGCPGFCHWQWDNYVDISASDINMSDTISVVKVRSAIFRVSYCKNAAFGECYGSYQPGPQTIALTGSWDNAITSFDVMRHTPIPSLDMMADGGTCSSLGGFGLDQPGGPASCDAHSDCQAPYRCTCDNPPSCSTSRCELAACFDDVYPNNTDPVRVYYHQHLKKNLVGLDLVADHAESWNSDVATRIREYTLDSRDFMRGTGLYGDGYAPDAPAGHAYGNMGPAAVVWAESTGCGGTTFASHIQFGAWCTLMHSNRPMPRAYRETVRLLFHEYTHTVQNALYRNGGSGFGGPDLGLGDGMADVQSMSMESTQTLGYQTVYDRYLQDWPNQEYCVVSVDNHPAGCYGMEYSDMPVYSAFAQYYDASLAWSYLGAQFMTPEGGTAINPNSYIYTSAAGTQLFKPLRYHRFYRQVADDLYGNPHTDPLTDRRAWVQRMANQATAGAGGVTWKRCLQDDPSDCALGAPGTSFANSSSFDYAFRRWAWTHVEYYTNAQRSRMDLKFEAGGVSGTRTPGGNDQPTFISLPFDLGGTTTPFTVILTARTRLKDDVLANRDSLRVYIDTDISGNWPGLPGKRYDNDYADTDQCWAFGHNFSGGTGCRYAIGSAIDEDGNQFDDRATMRFIPSTAFSNFAGGGSGSHTLYVAAYNDPIVYSVEVVKGIVTPITRPLSLRGDYCATFGHYDPQCKFDRAVDSVGVGTGGTAGDKVIQIVGRANDKPQFTLLSGANATEGIRVMTTEWMDPWVVGNETKWGAFHGAGMNGNRYLLRMEKYLSGSYMFKVQPHDAPFFDHVVTWDRPQALVAAVYYPKVRGLNFFGFMVDPVVYTHGVKVSGQAGGTSFNLVNFCQNASGSWSRVSEMVVSNGTWNSWPNWTTCERWYVMIGQAGPGGSDDTVGSVITVNIRGT